MTSDIAPFNPKRSSKIPRISVHVYVLTFLIGKPQKEVGPPLKNYHYKKYKIEKNNEHDRCTCITCSHAMH